MSVKKFFDAAKTGDLEALHANLTPETLNATDTFGYAALWWAASKGQTAAVEALVAEGAAVDKPNRSGTTPASMAAVNGHTRTLAVLAGAGFDLDKADNRGATPAWRAALNGSGDTLRFLAEANAGITAATRRGRYAGMTPLDIAREQGNDECIAIIKEVLVQRVSGGTEPRRRRSEGAGFEEG